MAAEMTTYQVISGIAIGISIIDAKLKLTEEVDFLWIARKPWQWTLDQFLYASCRVVPLFVWLFNIVIGSVLRQKRPHVLLKECRKRLIYETAVSYYLLAVIDLILWYRVYGLYKRSLLVRTILIALMVVQIGQFLAIVCVALPRARYTGTCILNSLDPALLCSLVSLEVFLHLMFAILIRMDRSRHQRFLGPQTMARIAPVFDVLIKQSWMMFIFMSVYATLVITSTFCSQQMGPATLSVFPLFVSGVSFLGCRLILNLRKVQITAREQAQTEFTIVEIAALTQVSIDVLDSWYTRSFPPACPQETTVNDTQLDASPNTVVNNGSIA